jgi:clan AA aspartic protease (TIGR02281 family)
MKRFLLIVATTFFCALSFAQKIIQMEDYNGVFRIPCKVNGAKMKLVFDTGASNVCLSLSMAEYLLDNDYITKKDIIGQGASTVADGRIVDHVIIIIKDLEIEGSHLFNVKAVVIEGQNAPLLLGQSAIQKLGPVEINGNILTIKRAESNDDLVDRLFEEANRALDNHMYQKAAEKYSQLYMMNQLSDYGIYNYASACFLSNDYDKAYELLSQINDFSYFEERKIDIYQLMGHIWSYFDKCSEAVNYYELSNKKIHNDVTEYNEKEAVFMNLRWQGDCYYYAQNYSAAADKYTIAANVFALMHNVDMAYLQRDGKNKLKKNEQSYRCDNIDYVLFRLIFCSSRSGAWSAKAFLLEATAMARAGNKYAMKMCNDAMIDPYSDAYYK